MRTRGRDHVLLALADRLFDDGSVQLLHLAIGDEPSVVVSDRVELVVFDRHRRLLPVAELLFDVSRGDHDEVDLLTLQARPGRVRVVGDVQQG